MTGNSAQPVLCEVSGFRFRRSGARELTWAAENGGAFASLTMPDRVHHGWFYVVHDPRTNRWARGSRLEMQEAAREAVFWLRCFGLTPPAADQDAPVRRPERQVEAIS